MMFTNDSDAGRRETETVIRVAAVFPNVINTDSIDGQRRQRRVLFVRGNHAWSKCENNAV